MPVTTRNQADAEGITDEDMASLDAPGEASASAAARFEEGEDYHPLFCLSDDVPEEVCRCTLPSHLSTLAPLQTQPCPQA